jgi:hypothetical protein
MPLRDSRRLRGKRLTVQGNLLHGCRIGRIRPSSGDCYEVRAKSIARQRRPSLQIPPRAPPAADRGSNLERALADELTTAQQQAPAESHEAEQNQQQELSSSPRPLSDLRQPLRIRKRRNSDAVTARARRFCAGKVSEAPGTCATTAEVLAGAGKIPHRPPAIAQV